MMDMMRALGTGAVLVIAEIPLLPRGVQDALWDIKVANETGCHGVMLVDHRHALSVSTFRAIRKEHPDCWIGVWYPTIPLSQAINWAPADISGIVLSFASTNNSARLVQDPGIRRSWKRRHNGVLLFHPDLHDRKLRERVLQTEQIADVFTAYGNPGTVATIRAETKKPIAVASGVSIDTFPSFVAAGANVLFAGQYFRNQSGDFIPERLRELTGMARALRH